MTTDQSTPARRAVARWQPAQWIILALALCFLCVSIGASIFSGNHLAAIGHLFTALALCALNIAIDPVSRPWLLDFLGIEGSVGQLVHDPRGGDSFLVSADEIQQHVRFFGTGTLRNRGNGPIVDGHTAYADLMDVVDKRFAAGEGVLVISETTPDQVIVLGVRNAFNHEKPFLLMLSDATVESRGAAPSPGDEIGRLYIRPWQSDDEIVSAIRSAAKHNKPFRVVPAQGPGARSGPDRDSQ